MMEIFFGLMVMLFLARFLLNSRIYNRENGTNMSLLFLPGWPSKEKIRKRNHYQLSTWFRFWWNTRKLKPENTRLASISNVMSVTFLVLLIGTVIHSIQ